MGFPPDHNYVMLVSPIPYFTILFSHIRSYTLAVLFFPTPALLILSGRTENENQIIYQGEAGKPSVGGVCYGVQPALATGHVAKSRNQCQHLLGYIGRNQTQMSAHSKQAK